jgi:hypothetical protein
VGQPVFLQRSGFLILREGNNLCLFYYEGFGASFHVVGRQQYFLSRKQEIQAFENLCTFFKWLVGLGLTDF